jgi:hypothetical protein
LTYDWPEAQRSSRSELGKLASPTASASSKEISAAIAASTRNWRAAQSIFPGEEELSVSGLVHLRGRVYDPLLAAIHFCEHDPGKSL